MLWVPKLKNNFLLLSILEDKGFSITINKGKVLIWPKGDIPYTTMSIQVGDGNPYELKQNPIGGS